MTTPSTDPTRTTGGARARQKLSCGHLVDDPTAVHYCAYIAVPSLQNLQPLSGAEAHPDELFLTIVLQSSELWLLVANADLERMLNAALAGPSQPSPIKLLGRVSEILKLLIAQYRLFQVNAADDFVAALRAGLPSSWFDSPQKALLDQRAAALTGRDWFAPGAGTPTSPLLRPMLKEFAETHRLWNLAHADLVAFLSRPADGTAPRAEPPAPLDWPTYNEYLRLGELLDLYLSTKTSDHHDELMFIAVHQVFELWFKLLLADLTMAVDGLLEGPPDVWRESVIMKRVIDVLSFLTQQIHMPETMLPTDFLSFRGGLSPASGSESLQFRLLELLSGLRAQNYLQAVADLGEAGEPGQRRSLLSEAIWRALNTPSLREAFLRALAARDVTILDLYQDMAVRQQNYDLFVLAEQLIRYDEQFALWRTNHVQMVERMIGDRPGTGGTKSGAGYLRTTLNYPHFFPELWVVRSLLDDVPRE